MGTLNLMVFQGCTVVRYVIDLRASMVGSVASDGSCQSRNALQFFAQTGERDE